MKNKKALPVQNRRTEKRKEKREKRKEKAENYPRFRIDSQLFYQLFFYQLFLPGALGIVKGAFGTLSVPSVSLFCFPRRYQVRTVRFVE